MKNNLSPSDKFYGPKLKIERAKQHIGDLNDQLGEFAKGNPYVVRVESPADPKRCNLIIRVKKPMSPCIMLTSGDAIHNLRSALDLLACDIVRPFNAGDTKGVYFPFGKSADDFEAELNSEK